MSWPRQDSGLLWAIRTSARGHLWLTLLLHNHGTDVLRVKGVLDVRDVGPVALNGVQHIVHPPEHLSRQVHSGTRLVFIVRNIDPNVLEASLHTFLSIA